MQRFDQTRRRVTCGHETHSLKDLTSSGRFYRHRWESYQPLSSRSICSGVPSNGLSVPSSGPNGIRVHHGSALGSATSTVTVRSKGSGARPTSSQASSTLSRNAAMLLTVIRWISTTQYLADRWGCYDAFHSVGRLHALKSPICPTTRQQSVFSHGLDPLETVNSKARASGV